MARALQVAAGVLLVAALAVAGGYAYFALTFGSADHAEFTLSAQRVPADGVAENATVIEDPDAAAVVDRAHRNGTAVTLERYDLDGAYVERNGTYFRVDVADADLTAERPVVTIERVNETDGRVVAAAELPRADGDAFGRAWRAWMVRNTDRGTGNPPVEGVYRTVPDDADSVFVPEQEVRFVSRENRTFRVRVERRNVTLDADRYELERVAANESAFVDLLVRDASGAWSGDAPPAFERAVENGTYVSRADTFEEAWRPMEPVAELCGVDADAFATGEGTATCYVRYDGEYYRLGFDGYDTFA